MRNKILYFTSLAILSAVYAAQPAAAPTGASVVTMPTYGFRINSFEMATSNDVRSALVMTYPALPMSGNRAFPPNVNVMVVGTDKTMADYMNRERLGMTAQGFTIVKNGDVANGNDWKIEYINVVGGAAMHWYAHAVWTPGRIYVATGGTPDEMWTMYGDKIKDCVNSLQVTGTAVIPAATPAPAASTTR